MYTLETVKKMQTKRQGQLKRKDVHFRNSEKDADKEARASKRKDVNIRNSEREAKELKRKDVHFRNSEKDADKEARASKRKDVNIRNSEKDADKEARASKRKDVNIRNSEKDADKEARASKRKDVNIRNSEKDADKEARKLKRLTYQSMMNDSMARRIQVFRNHVREGLTYACINCRRLRFRNQVIEWSDKIQESLEKIPNPSDKALFMLCIHCKDPRVKTNDKHWICFTCHKYLGKGKVPPMSHFNNLQIYTEEESCILDENEKETLCSLSPLEQTLVALNVPFQLLYQTPVSRWRATQVQIF